MKAPASQRFDRANILSKVRCLLLDIDGTIILGQECTPGAGQLFEAIEQSGRSFLVVTNNNSISPAEHAERLRGAGLPVRAEDILSSAEVAAAFLREEWKCRSVMVLGAKALREAVLGEGLELTDENPECVVVGFDTELCYERLKRACFLIERGCKWLATHPDVAMPGADGLWPDCGAITAAIRATTGQEPDIVLGKPSKYMAQAAIRRSGFAAEQVMMVGDRAETDVLLAKENGMCSTLVLTGATGSKQAEASGAELIVNDLGQLAQLLLENNTDN